MSSLAHHASKSHVLTGNGRVRGLGDDDRPVVKRSGGRSGSFLLGLLLGKGSLLVGLVESHNAVRNFRLASKPVGVALGSEAIYSTLLCKAHVLGHLGAAAKEDHSGQNDKFHSNPLSVEKERFSPSRRTPSSSRMRWRFPDRASASALVGLSLDLVARHMRPVC